MHDTHHTTISHKTLSLTPVRVRPRLLDVLYSHWVITTLLCLSLQLGPGTATLLANELGESSGTLRLTHADATIDAVQLDAQMQVSIKGLLAELTLTQTFSNTTNQWVEGSYLFPLGEKASIQGMVIRVGERVINGKIMPRVDAQHTYNAARQAGQIASLVEQQRPNLFTARVANIAPAQNITVILSVMMPVTIDQRHMKLRLPTTLTPRYTNAQSEEPEALQSPFVTPAIARGPRLDMSLTIDGLESLAAVQSQTHSLRYLDDSIELMDIAMDQDIVIQWPMDTVNSTTGETFVTRHDGQRYVQIMLTPKLLSENEPSPARELVLVIDKSGSMAGVSIDAAREALHFALDGLSHQDTFNLVAFDDRYQSLFPASTPVTEQSIRLARRFIDRLDANGGTEMQDALNFALTNNTLTTDTIAENTDLDHRLKQVVFMTDGSVGYEDVLLSTIKHQLGNSRLFTVGIGPAPNAWFLKKAAEVGRGISLNIHHAHDVADAVTRLLTTLSTPVLTDINVQYPQGYGETYPDPIPDLYAGKPGMWVSRVSGDATTIIITGKHNGERWTTTLPLANTISQSTHAPAVAMHWARGKIESLIDEQRYAADPDLHKSAITELAVSTGLVTRYTSLIAVEEKPSKPIATPFTAQKVANLIPAGNTMMSVAMPQGAAGADTLTLLSLLLGTSGIAALALSRCRFMKPAGRVT